ncbi:hypothetical protein EY01_15375, partial [Staphylococcus aureus]
MRADALTLTLSHREREQTLKTATEVAVLLLQPHRINMPDRLGILLDGPVGREIAHIGDVIHRGAGPLLLLTVQLVNLI